MNQRTRCAAGGKKEAGKLWVGKFGESPIFLPTNRGRFMTAERSRKGGRSAVEGPRSAGVPLAPAPLRVCAARVLPPRGGRRDALRYGQPEARATGATGDSTQSKNLEQEPVEKRGFSYSLPCSCVCARRFHLCGGARAGARERDQVGAPQVFPQAVRMRDGEPGKESHRAMAAPSSPPIFRLAARIRQAQGRLRLRCPCRLFPASE